MRQIALIAATLFWANVAAAQAQLAVAMDRLGIADMIAVMQLEGASYADDLNNDLLGGQGGALWHSQIRSIYNADRMSEVVRAALATLPDDDLRRINVFYGSDLGTQVIGLEIAARKAMLDKDLETLARDAYARAEAENPASVLPLQQLEQAGDMIERNVSGALTANYRFYRAMVDGGAFEMSEDDILRETWAQEDDIRADTASWLMGYLMLSYQPLGAADFDAYLAFTGSPEGRALNAAIFDGFNAMYGDISYALGRAVALNMIGSDL